MKMSSNREPSLGLFAKYLLVLLMINLLLWHLTSDKTFKFQSTAQLLPANEVSALNSIGEKLEIITTAYFTETYCNETAPFDSLGFYCNCSYMDNNVTVCHIRRISMSNKGLTGVVPEEVANLTYLEELDLSYNKLQGSIPASLGNMSSLYSLDLSNNQLTGSIPPSLGNLKAKIKKRYTGVYGRKANAQVYDRTAVGQVGDRTAEGQVGDGTAVGQVGDKTAANAHCQPEPWKGFGDPYSGRIGRPYIGRCSMKSQDCPFFTLDLSMNQLEGSIPPTLGNITPDKSWTLSPDICTNSYISLSNNQLCGNIPGTLANLTFLSSLDLHNNLLNGSVPSTLGDMASLSDLILSDNNLSGTLPPTLGNLKYLSSLLLESNYFTGNLSESFVNLTNMETFSISGNYLSGPFPAFIKNWTLIDTLSLSGNNFEGTIPLEIFNLSHLDRLMISDVKNSFFQFPPRAELRASLTYLVLRNCSITGQIPPYLSNMTQLNYLDLSFNSLTGGIPDSWTNLNLSYMSFAQNMLNETIPNWIHNQSTWTKIDLSYNKFSRPNFKVESIKNMNLFACCNSTNTPNKTDLNQIMEDKCPEGKPLYNSLFINCGGEEMDIDGHHYYSDNGTSEFYISPVGNWAYSTSGSFFSENINSSDYIKQVKCGFSIPDAPLYEKARLSPASLKYYGFCLRKGIYNVTLHFAEIVFGDDEDYDSRSMKRIFDVYIQGERRLTNFNIKKMKNETNKGAIVQNLTAVVNNSLLEIHLYWAGKGSYSGQPGSNGPMISAISVITDPEPGDEKLSPLQIALITVASILLAVLLLLALAWAMGWLGKKELHEIKVGLEKPVTLKQLKDATRRFSKDMEIGKGNFGTVYRAELPNHIVAVKRFFTLSNEGINKLKSEFYTLESLRHENLVRLYDVYVGKGLYLMVYEYMENRSLADALFDPKAEVTLDWQARFNICLGIARGLKYLHEHPRLKMVHRGIKAANILLDATLKAKISDFGNSVLYAEDDQENQFKIIKIEASHGYMAPEYPMYGTISHKYDVYGYGVVILEIVTGKKNAGHNFNQEQLEFLVDEVCVADTKGKLLEMIDKSLTSYDAKEAINLLKLAVKCTNISPSVRPTMSEIVSVLTGEKSIDDISVPDNSNDGEESLK